MKTRNRMRTLALLALALALALTPAMAEDMPVFEWADAPEPAPAADIAPPEISFSDVQMVVGGISCLSGEMIVIDWQTDAGAESYRVEIADDSGKVIRRLDTTDAPFLLTRDALSMDQTYTVTVIAIPASGTLANGVRATSRFALVAAPAPEPTPTPTPEPTPAPALQEGEIADSWEQIIAAIDDGSVQQRYAIGAWKPLDLGEFGTINMQLVAFYADERADGKGRAATTWIARELLPEKRPMNKNGSTKGGWRDCDLRAWLNDTLLPAIPSNVRNHIVTVNKSQEEYRNYTTQTTQDSVWIPDRGEMFAGLYAGFFKGNADRVKTLGGSSAWWWLRSANNVNFFYAVGSDGSSNASIAYSSGGVALGFCL